MQNRHWFQILVIVQLKNFPYSCRYRNIWMLTRPIVQKQMRSIRLPWMPLPPQPNLTNVWPLYHMTFHLSYYFWYLSVLWPLTYEFTSDKSSYEFAKKAVILHIFEWKTELYNTFFSCLSITNCKIFPKLKGVVYN